MSVYLKKEKKKKLSHDMKITKFSSSRCNLKWTSQKLIFRVDEKCTEGNGPVLMQSKERK